MTKYNISRRNIIKGMRTSHGMNNHVWSIIKEALVVVLALTIIVLLYGWLQEKDLADKVKSSLKSDLEHKEMVLVGLLNHKGLFIDNELHVCSIGNTYIKKGDGI